MKFKSDKITVTRDDPYSNDSLSRKSHVESLSLILRNISSPIVLSINAPWGQGKTTFLEMLNLALLKENCQTVTFSAWETDFAEDPSSAFIGEMDRQIATKLNGNSKKLKAWNTAKNAGEHILKQGIPALIRVATYNLIDTEKLIEDEVSKLAGSLSNDLVVRYTLEKEPIEKFRQSITNFLKEDDKPSKLYVLIDELDRCRPNYAIEFLERIKHLLEIEGLVFVLAMDREQLAHSVKAIYGNEFESRAYLRRFIDIEYSLPTVNHRAFITQLFNNFGFAEFFSRRRSSGHNQDENDLKDTLLLLIENNHLSLRDIEHLLAKINLVILSTNDNVYLYPHLLIFLIVLKELRPMAYQDYIRDGSSPELAIKVLHEMIPEGLRLNTNGVMVIETYLITAKHERHDPSPADSVLSKHREIVDDESEDEQTRHYSQSVLRFHESFYRTRHMVSLSSLVERIEILGQFKFD